MQHMQAPTPFVDEVQKQRGKQGRPKKMIVQKMTGPFDPATMFASPQQQQPETTE